jgi:HlyD family secretion protein
MKRFLLWTVAAIALLVILGALVGAYFFLRPTATRATGRTARVTRSDLEVVVKTQGVIVPATTVEVKSRASGYVLRIHASAGDRVKADQILLEVDPARSRLNEEEARNEVEAARSQVRLTREGLDPERIEMLRRELDRQQELAERGLITRKDLENAQYQLASAERSYRSQEKQLEAANARLDAANTRLRRAETESSFTIVRAPIDGVVMERLVEIGSGVTSFSDSVQGGTVLFRLGSLDEPAFDGSIAISDLAKVKPGLSARVTSDAWPTPAAGTVSYVGQEAQTTPQNQSSSSQNRAATFKVRVQLEAMTDRSLPLNVPALAEIVISKVPDALVVPFSCVQHRPDGQGVIHESVNGATRERVVKLGPVSGANVQILGDVAEGTEVVRCGGADAPRS